MRMVTRALDRVSDVLVAVGVVAAILMALHVFADVVSKFLFNFPLAGTLEIVANYYMVALIFAPLAYVQRKDGHIAAELLTRFLSPGVMRWVAALTYFLMAGFAALLVWRSSVEALRSFDVRESVQTSGYFVYTFPARWIVPAGLVAMAAYALVQALKAVSRASDRDV